MTNEIVINGVHHVLVGETDFGRREHCDHCSLEAICGAGFFCKFMFKREDCHFEINK